MIDNLTWISTIIIVDIVSRISDYSILVAGDLFVITNSIEIGPLNDKLTSILDKKHHYIIYMYHNWRGSTVESPAYIYIQTK